MVDCVWFSFHPDCDIPNWFTMVIELIIGGTVASFFFWIQHNYSNKINKIWNLRHKENSSMLEKRAKLLISYCKELMPIYERYLISTTEKDLSLITKKENFVKTEITELEELFDESLDVVDPKLKKRIEDLLHASKSILNTKEIFHRQSKLRIYLDSSILR
ncbi:MAG: hypothetical protein OER82_00025 [Nitrosopumilus sp.]|nr:hypothetical protein [Nitrosopumilus sp.]